MEQNAELSRPFSSTAFCSATQEEPGSPLTFILKAAERAFYSADIMVVRWSTETSNMFAEDVC
jgi:hypothetical protein